MIGDNDSARVSSKVKDPNVGEAVEMRRRDFKDQLLERVVERVVGPVERRGGHDNLHGVHGDDDFAAGEGRSAAGVGGGDAEVLAPEGAVGEERGPGEGGEIDGALLADDVAEMPEKLGEEPLGSPLAADGRAVERFHRDGRGDAGLGSGRG